MMLKKVKLSSIEANPFRDIKHYPFDQEKIRKLKESIRETEFWANIVGRQVGRKIEIAYGHHRIESLRRMRWSKPVPVVVQDLSDDDMAKMMARENAEEYQLDPLVEHQTVRAVLQGLADGRLDLGRLGQGPRLSTDRYGIRRPAAEFTRTQLAAYIGWTPGKTKRILMRLETVTTKGSGVTEDDLVGLSSSEAEEVVRGARRAKKAGKDPKKAARAAKKAAQEGKGKRGAREAAQKAAPVQRPKAIPNVDQFCAKLAQDLACVIADDSLGARLETLVENAENCPLTPRKRVMRQLASLMKRSVRYVEQLDVEGRQPAVKKVTQSLRMLT